MRDPDCELNNPTKSLYMYGGPRSGWQRIAGPFASRDRERQAMAVVDWYTRQMTPEQVEKLQRAIAKERATTDPFYFVALCEFIKRGMR